MGRRPTTERVEVPDVTTDPPEMPSAETIEPDGPDIDELGDFAAFSEADRTVTWYIYRKPMPGEVVAGDAAPGVVKYCARFKGPLDIEELKETVGGGVFIVLGMRRNERGKHVRYGQRTIGIDAARRIFANDPVPAVSATPVATMPTPNANGEMGAIAQLLQRIEAKVNAPAPTPAPPQLSIKDVIELATMISGGREEKGSPDIGFFKELTTMQRDWLKMGRESMGETDSDPVSRIIEKVSPLMEKIIDRAAARRRPARRDETVNSRAEVVTEPPTEDEGQYRMAAVCDSLSRAIAESVPPEDFAGVVEAILTPEDLALVRTAPAAGVVARIQAAASQFPVLGTPHAADYITALVALLQAPDDEPSDPPTT